MKTKNSKSEKPEGHDKVMDYLDNLQHPLKNEIEAVRKIILSANKQLTEHIKWNAPSFCFNNDDRITFNLHGKDSFRLIFHCGVKIKDKKLKGKLPEGTSVLLDWASDDRAIVTFTDMNDVKAKKNTLIKTVNAWIALSIDN